LYKIQNNNKPCTAYVVEQWNGGAAIHQNGYSLKWLFIETAIHQNGYTPNQLFIESA